MKHVMNIRISLMILFSMLCIFSFAQEPKKKGSGEFWHRVSVGGSLGLQLGDVTGIVVSPDVKVRIVSQFYGGLGFTYQYIRYKDYYYDTKAADYVDFRSNAYGGRVFLRYYLRDLFDNFLGNIFAHAEYEYIDFVQPLSYDPAGSVIDPYNNKFSPKSEHLAINSLFVGAGYSQPLGGRAFLDLLVLFNLNDTYNSPYSNPVIRIGFGVGL